MVIRKSSYFLLSAIVSTLMLVACNKQTSNGQTVGQKVDSAIDKTNENMAAASAKVGIELDKAGNAVSNAASSIAASSSATAARTGEAISDGAITTSINADLLKDPQLSVVKIDVDTKQGVVALNGLAPTEDARLRGGKIAAAVKGVVRVDNHLVVKKVP